MIRLQRQVLLQKIQVLWRIQQLQRIFLSLEEVVDIYMGEYPNAQIQKVDFDKDFGDWTYEITGVSENREYDVEINAVSGDIIKADEDDVDDDAYLAFDTIITPEEAIEIAKTALAEKATVFRRLGIGCG